MGLQCVIVVFPDHIHTYFGAKSNGNCMEQIVSCANGLHGAHHSWLQKGAALSDLNEPRHVISNNVAF